MVLRALKPENPQTLLPYYPYWHPTMWCDVAVLTSDTSRCGYYRAESEKAKGRGGLHPFSTCFHYCTLRQTCRPRLTLAPREARPRYLTVGFQLMQETPFDGLCKWRRGKTSRNRFDAMSNTLVPSLASESLFTWHPLLRSSASVVTQKVMSGAKHFGRRLLQDGISIANSPIWLVLSTYEK